jgi:hypothetical protein
MPTSLIEHVATTHLTIPTIGLGFLFLCTRQADKLVIWLLQFLPANPAFVHLLIHLLSLI